MGARVRVREAVVITNTTWGETRGGSQGKPRRASLANGYVFHVVDAKWGGIEGDKGVQVVSVVSVKRTHHGESNARACDWHL